MRWHRGWLLPSRLYLNRKHELNRSNPWPHQFTSSFYVSFLSRVKGTGSRFSACLFIKMLFFCQDTLYRLCKQYDLLVMKAAQYKFLILWSCHNVIKEPICTLTRQSLALDQLKYLQIAVNYMYIFCSLLFLRYIKNCATAGFWADSIKTNLHGKQCLIELAEKIPGIIFWHFHIQTLMTLDHCAGFCLP